MRNRSKAIVLAAAFGSLIGCGPKTQSECIRDEAKELTGSAEGAAIDSCFERFPDAVPQARSPLPDSEKRLVVFSDADDSGASEQPFKTWPYVYNGSRNYIVTGVDVLLVKNAQRRVVRLNFLVPVQPLMLRQLPMVEGLGEGWSFGVSKSKGHFDSVYGYPTP